MILVAHAYDTETAGVIFNRSNAAIASKAAEVGKQSSLIEADEIELIQFPRQG
jgi:hypothetical protein